MILEHINLVIKDIPRALEFYQAAFPHWQVRGGGKSEWYGKPRNWIHFGDDYNYISFSDHGKRENRDLKGDQVGLAHFAYRVDNISALITRLESAGFEIAINGAQDSTQKSVYFIDPDGFEVEFVQYLTDIPSERNKY
ncbi:VOC family protein [Parashewanella spongiae]|uniref:VOC family protein n=1 Tax=Parashewanella spongiae TaxID=342950 RepID=A0A3A6UKB8_9GAMM|nr:VOC family protein [Parashewanella spongiae]MCL1077815.1 VOC family protein [Parashewanella spongiae]RJY18009.1 VOC family protein [Parashewanella spongiae]